MYEYTNDQLAIGTLPSLEDIEWVEVDRNLIVRDVIRNLILSCALLGLTILGGMGLLSVGTVLFSLLGSAYFCLAFLIIVVFIAWPRLEFPHRGYALRELDIAQRNGLVIRQVSTAPFSRVQHVTVSQGLLDRMFKLATLQIYTAGQSMSIKGFYVDHAHTLREHILERVAEINLLKAEALANSDNQVFATTDSYGFDKHER